MRKALVLSAAWVLVAVFLLAAPAPQHAAGIGASAEGRESFLYVVAINKDNTVDPDFLALIGADPADDNYGKIFRRVDMPHVADGLHHFASTADGTRLVIPGRESDRLYVFDISEDPTRPSLIAENADLKATGYQSPHTLIHQPDGTVLIGMEGEAQGLGPAGIIQVDGATGEFRRYFGPGPERTLEDKGPKYMYDIAWNPALNRGITTTFAWPALVSFFNPLCCGDEVAVWDLQQRKVIQTVSLGPDSGALAAHWIDEPGSSYGYTITLVTGMIWLWDDEDADGFYDFNPVYVGLSGPADMLLSPDHRFMYIANWLGDAVLQFDISDRWHPRLIAQATVPHPVMLRLSRDGLRLYVTNSANKVGDQGEPTGSNDGDYGLWLFNVNTVSGGLTSETPDGSAWVDFDQVQKKFTVGPAGPHMVLFDGGMQEDEH